jgi:hypothetical protein
LIARLSLDGNIKSDFLSFNWVYFFAESATDAFAHFSGSLASLLLLAEWIPRRRRA